MIHFHRCPSCHELARCWRRGDCPDLEHVEPPSDGGVVLDRAYCPRCRDDRLRAFGLLDATEPIPDMPTEAPEADVLAVPKADDHRRHVDLHAEFLRRHSDALIAPEAPGLLPAWFVVVLIVLPWSLVAVLLFFL